MVMGRPRIDSITIETPERLLAAAEGVFASCGLESHSAHTATVAAIPSAYRVRVFMILLHWLNCFCGVIVAAWALCRRPRRTRAADGGS